MITPTVGRIVWYRPSKFDHGAMMIQNDQPLAAIVAYVWSDHLVNLTVSDHSGMTHSRTSVALKQGDQHDLADAGAYCEWMPYQKAVAKGEIAPTLHAGDKGAS